MLTVLKILLALLSVASVTNAAGPYVSTRSASVSYVTINGGSGASIGVISYAAADLSYPLASAVVSVTLFLPQSFNGGSKTFSYSSTVSYTNFELFFTVQEQGGSTTTLTPNPFYLVVSGSFSTGGPAPGIIVMSFDDNALIPISSVKFPYTGTFAPPMGTFAGVAQTTLSNFISQITTAGAFTKIPYFSQIVARASFGTPRILAAAVTINCQAAKTYTLYATTSKPSSSVDTTGIFFASAYGSQVTLENVVQRGTGINARLSGLTVDFNVARFSGVNHDCHTDSPTNTPSMYSDASVVLQFFPEVGPMISIILDSGTSSQFQATSSWTSPAISSTISAGQTYTYYLPIGDSNWKQPTGLIAGGPEFYRSAAQTISSLLGASPFGTWRLVIVDANGSDNTYWCITSAHLNLQTCDSCPSSNCATTPCC